jgi:hypothetical protein
LNIFEFPPNRAEVSFDKPVNRQQRAMAAQNIALAKCSAAQARVQFKSNGQVRGVTRFVATLFWRSGEKRDAAPNNAATAATTTIAVCMPLVSCEPNESLETGRTSVFNAERSPKFKEQMQLRRTIELWPALSIRKAPKAERERITHNMAWSADDPCAEPEATAIRHCRAKTKAASVDSKTTAPQARSAAAAAGPLGPARTSCNPRRPAQ